MVCECCDLDVRVQLGFPVSAEPGAGYGALVLALVLAGFWNWVRAARSDGRLVQIYLWGIIGAFAGAKLVYGLAEGWNAFGDAQQWMAWATGKSILGGLLGGWLGVEGAKRATGFRAPTGDRFALMVTASMTVGRLGCLLHGCCLGVPVCTSFWSLPDSRGIHRWPAVPVELVFTGFCWVLLLVLRKQGRFRNQLFHLFLIAYGIFRMVHETLRDTPRVAGGFSGYQWVALAMTGLAAVAYVRRARSCGGLSGPPARRSG